jgi:beta-lactamase regulating signal transducer with metallopeptidase domain
MIFVLRGIMVSLAFFALLYSFLSSLLVLGLRSLRGSRLQKNIHADSLFALRVSPFAISALISLFLTLPSFLMFESHSLDEDMATFALTVCGMVILGMGLYRVMAAEARTRRVVSAALESAVALRRDAVIPTVMLAQSVAPIMLVGVRVPQILISAAACKLLSDEELWAAVRHETAHSRSRDNLKKAVLNSLPFPGVACLEEAWQEASEWAADDRAVSSRDEALDLAAALIKLARHFPSQIVPELATGLVSEAGSVSSRVERLVAWKESSDVNRPGRGYLILLAVMTFFGLAAKLGATLVVVHSLTERLVP